ncbi:MAG TPA: DUF1275 family protein, partial [Amycolatopsis sp.]|nr:DUF1275 family protein [Amycolatopsis sp.]
FGLQNATVRRIAAPDLTTTVLTTTLIGLAADSHLAGGPGARPHRRGGSIPAMFAGAATGAVLLRVTSPTVVITFAAALLVVVTMLLTTPRTGSHSPHRLGDFAAHGVERIRG